MVIDGILFRFIDTAGLRETNDTIESLGIERSRKAMEQAQIVVAVSDKEPGAKSQEPEVSGQFVIQVQNKADLLGDHTAWAAVKDRILISAKNGEIEPLRQELVRLAKEQINHNGTIISNARHYEALVRAKEAIERVQIGLQDGLSGEFLSMDLQDCLNALGEITGKITSQEVLNNIFAKFCIGK